LLSLTPFLVVGGFDVSVVHRPAEKKGRPAGLTALPFLILELLSQSFNAGKALLVAG
jgi:hypothetical protein